MSTLMNIPFSHEEVSISDIKEINSSFATGTLKIMYLGRNRNHTSFSKEAVINAIPSLKNVPVVCHYMKEESEIGGHDMCVSTDANGELILEVLTEPIGVVPDHAKIYFKKDTDYNGKEHEYLVAENVILWKRQNAYDFIIKEHDGRIDHSMEINVIDYVNDPDDYCDIKNFEFTALCLLGNCEPCFEGSELQIYSVKSFKDKMNEMMNELKEAYPQVISSATEDNIDNNYSTEGGRMTLNKEDLIAKYNIDLETLDFSIDDYSYEELEEKFAAMTVEPIEPKEPEVDFGLNSTFMEELISAIEEPKRTCEWGEMSCYWYVDCNRELNEVYCWDTSDWLLYGFTYGMNGDKVVIDFECKKRKKYDIVDFDEGEQLSPFAPTFAKMESVIAEANQNNAEITEKYNEATTTISNMESQLEELRSFKSQIEAEALESQRNEIFAKFEDLIGVEAFESLKENRAEYSLEDLEEKCFAIRGRIVPVKFSTQPQPALIKQMVDKAESNNADKPYGGLFEKYGIYPNNN